MRSDRRGDMGFMEAMVAFMAVTVMLTAFMGVLATTTVVTADPTESLDPGEFTGTIESDGFRGAAVTVTVPGGFCPDIETFTVGDMDGMLYSRSIPGLVTDDSGRVLPAVYEVVLCA